MSDELMAAAQNTNDELWVMSDELTAAALIGAVVMAAVMIVVARVRDRNRFVMGLMGFLLVKIQI